MQQHYLTNATSTKNGICFTVVTPSGDPVGDPVRIAQVLSNVELQALSLRKFIASTMRGSMTERITTDSGLMSLRRWNKAHLRVSLPLGEKVWTHQGSGWLHLDVDVSDSIEDDS